MLNFEIKKSTRKCFADEKDFSPGEVFYSVLMETGDDSTERRDFCLDHFCDPAGDANCLGWWKARMPERDSGKVYWAPRKVMLAYFEHVLKLPAPQDLAYVTALVLVQKKILVLEDTDENGNLQLRNRMSRDTYQVPDCEISPARMSSIQHELSDRLFMDEPLEDEDVEDSEWEAEDPQPKRESADG